MGQTKSTTNQTANYQQLLYLVLKGKTKGLLVLGARLHDGYMGFLCNEPFISHKHATTNPIILHSLNFKAIKQKCEELKISSFEEGLKYVLEVINKNDIHTLECLVKLGFACFVMAYSCFPKLQKKELARYFACEEILRGLASEAIGYWTSKLERRIAYVSNQGANSRELGEMSKEEAKKILEKFGGIAGYNSFGYGKKKPIRDEIEKKLRLKDSRQIYNILKRIKVDMQDD